MLGLGPLTDTGLTCGFSIPGQAHVGNHTSYLRESVSGIEWMVQTIALKRETEREPALQVFQAMWRTDGRKLHLSVSASVPYELAFTELKVQLRTADGDKVSEPYIFEPGLYRFEAGFEPVETRETKAVETRAAP